MPNPTTSLFASLQPGDLLRVKRPVIGYKPTLGKSGLIDTYLTLPVKVPAGAIIKVLAYDITTDDGTAISVDGAEIDLYNNELRFEKVEAQ